MSRVERKIQTQINVADQRSKLRPSLHSMPQIQLPGISHRDHHFTSPVFIRDDDSVLFACSPRRSTPGPRGAGCPYSIPSTLTSDTKRHLGTGQAILRLATMVAFTSLDCRALSCDTIMATVQAIQKKKKKLQPRLRSILK